MGAWILFFVFCIPAVIAWVRDHSSRTAITILSLLNALFLEVSSIFGLFFGIILLLWAIIGRTVQKVVVINEEKEADAEKKQDGNFKEIEPAVSSSYTQHSPSVADEISKFAELKEKGIITEEEFQQQKNRLLKQ